MPGHTSAMETALQTLVEAAEAFASSLPPTQESDRERHALLEAISQAQAFLPIDITPPLSASPASSSDRS
jgi:hypothetical protein